jgi:hypothetical protein
MLMSLMLVRTEGLCRRCTSEDVADAIKLPMHLPATNTVWQAQAHRQDALRLALLKDSVELCEKYTCKGTESEGHKASRRNEQLLQLFLCMHVLAAEPPGARCWHSCCYHATDSPYKKRTALKC